MRANTNPKFVTPKFSSSARAQQDIKTVTLDSSKLKCDHDHDHDHDDDCDCDCCPSPRKDDCCCKKDHYTVLGGVANKPSEKRNCWTICNSGVHELCGDIDYNYDAANTFSVGNDSYGVSPDNYAIVITASHVVLDGKGFTIRGNDVALGAIIVASDVRNVVIKNVRIFGFAAVGVLVLDAAAGIIIDNTNVTKIGLGSKAEVDTRYKIKATFGGVSLAGNLRAGIATAGFTYRHGGYHTSPKRALPAGAAQFYALDLANNNDPLSYANIAYSTHEITVSNCQIHAVRGPKPMQPSTANPGYAAYPNFVTAGVFLPGTQYILANDLKITDIWADDSARGIMANNSKDFNYARIKTQRIVAGNGLVGVSANPAAFGVVDYCTSLDNLLELVGYTDTTVTPNVFVPIPTREQRQCTGMAFPDCISVTLNHNTTINTIVPRALVGPNGENVFRLKQASGLLIRGAKNLLINGHSDTNTNNLAFEGDSVDYALASNGNRARPGAGVYHGATSQWTRSVGTTVPVEYYTIRSGCPVIADKITYDRPVFSNLLDGVYQYDGLEAYEVELHNIAVVESDVGIWLDSAARWDYNVTPAVNQTLTVYENTYNSVPLKNLPLMKVYIVDTEIVLTQYNPNQQNDADGQDPDSAGQLARGVGVLLSRGAGSENQLRYRLVKSDLEVVVWEYQSTSGQGWSANLPPGYWSNLTAPFAGL